MSKRISQRFTALKSQGRGGLVTFITAGDPDLKTSADILKRLPDAGADLIELGMPFTDPMADGSAIQEASLRALKAGATLKKTLALVSEFRAHDNETPLILMGYFNPVMAYGVEAFIKDAADAGVDGLIIVDLPPEEDMELRVWADVAEIDIIRLATPTTDDARLPRVLDGASGFLYYVSVAGVTGTKSAESDDIGAAVSRIKSLSELPVAVGFGIKTADAVRDVANLCDAAVVGSAIVSKIKENLDDEGKAKTGLVDAVADFVQELSSRLDKRVLREETGNV